MLTRPNPDRDLIRLCKKTIEALKADFVACTAKCDAQEIFVREKPAYPCDAANWRITATTEGSRSLRRFLKTEWARVTPSYRTKMRAEIAAVVAWERRTDEVRKSTGLHAAEIREARTTSRVHALMKQVVAMPATTIYGVACKASIIEHWLNDGYDLNGGDGEDLAMNIIDEVRLLGTGGNNNGKIRVSRGYEVVGQEASEMAAAA